MLAFHVDMNFVSFRPEYIERWLDRLAGMGYTAIVWELEDKVEWTTCPECVHPEAMQKDVFRRLLSHAHRIGLRNIPLLQTIGHAEYVLKHPRYHAWREDPAYHDCYCVSNAAVRRFLVDWIAEYCGLFDGLFGSDAHFHLGGDEAYRFASCPTCRSRAAEIGRNALYAEHVGALSEPLLERGITPGIWGDMILTQPDDIDVVPPEVTIWDWNYWDGTDSPPATRVWGRGVMRADEIDEEVRRSVPDVLDPEGRLVPFHSARFLKRKGRAVVVCSAARSSGDSFFFGQHDVHGPNVVGAVHTAHSAGLVGSCVTSWGIRVHPWETQMPWISMAGLASIDPELSYEATEAGVAQELFGIPRDEFLALQRGLGATYPFARRRECGIQFDRLKDPVPPPEGYVGGLLAEWSATPGLPAALREEIEQGREALDAAASLLRRLIAGAHPGGGPGQIPVVGVLDAYSRALHFQTWAARFAAEILAGAGGMEVTRDLHQVIGATRRTMACWTGEWMTPRYAELVAGLLYGPIEEYCTRLSG